MEKLVTGPEAADMVDLRLPVKQNLHLIAKAKGVKVNQLNVMIWTATATAWWKKSAKPVHAPNSSWTATSQVPSPQPGPEPAWTH